VYSLKLRESVKMKQLSVILAQPQMGENIGAAARAMCNFGLTDLRLVSPRDGWPNQAAINNASGAFEHIPQPRVFERFEDAIADLHYVVATTARTRKMAKTVLSPTKLAETIQQKGEKCGIVFGRERTGLENDEIALCQDIVEIPTNPAFSSLNLGQAVLLLSYELFLKHNTITDITPHTAESLPASQDQVHELCVRLEDELEKARFFRDEGLKPTMIRNIRGFFTRSQMTDQEVRTFHGMISALTGKKTGA